jgi:RNA polymerase sigma factor for flagellar operon FliA
LVEELPRIERVVTGYGRRHGLSADQIEELASEVKLKLLEDDYAVLRKFEGRSSLETYLTTVVHRLLLDLRAAELGKWRPTAGAQALGPTAVELEREIDRDGHSAEEAVAIVAARSGQATTVLRDLVRALPVRGLGRSRPADADLTHHASADPRPDELTRAREARQAKHDLHRHLDAELQMLADEERLALRLRFAEGLDIRAIAAILGRPQRPFYRELERILGGLRERLVARGCAPELVQELLELGDLVEPIGRPVPDLLEISAGRPSLQVTAALPSKPHET